MSKQEIEAVIDRALEAAHLRAGDSQGGTSAVVEVKDLSAVEAGAIGGDLDGD